MPSPFPGMDPYLEDAARWPDLHQSLITYIRDALQPTIRPRYHARIGERLYVVQPAHGILPDVFVIQRERVPAGPVMTTTLAPDAPVLISGLPEEVREVFVEIVDLAEGARVVTIIEVLSPTNKTAGKDHEYYCRRQEEILASPVNLVEIDLLRQGVHTVMIPEDALLSLQPWRYLVAISRATRRDQYAVYPIPLHQRLPRVIIPLADPDPDAVLDLQAVFERAYDNGAYADLIDYKRPPRAPLDPDEAAWVDALLREKGLRS